MYWIVFIGEFILLFFTAQSLSQSLFLLFYRLFRSQSLAIHLLAVVFLPGVIIHELSHFLVAEILQVPTGEMEFMPKAEAGSVKLGSVQVARTDFLRRFFIGVAPILLGSTVLLLLVWYASSGFSFENAVSSTVSIAKYLLVLYGVFVVSNTMFSSKKDLEGAVEFMAILVVAILAFYLFRSSLFFQIAGSLFQDSVTQKIQPLVLLLLLPVSINVVFSLVLRLLLRRG